MNRWFSVCFHSYKCYQRLNLSLYIIPFFPYELYVYGFMYVLSYIIMAVKNNFIFCMTIHRIPNVNKYVFKPIFVRTNSAQIFHVDNIWKLYAFLDGQWYLIRLDYCWTYIIIPITIRRIVLYCTLRLHKVSRAILFFFFVSIFFVITLFEYLFKT